MAGRGSKWGPYLRTLRMRSLSTPTVHALADTRAVELIKEWNKDVYDLRLYCCIKTVVDLQGNSCCCELVVDGMQPVLMDLVVLFHPYATPNLMRDLLTPGE